MDKCWDDKLEPASFLFSMADKSNDVLYVYIQTNMPRMIFMHAITFCLWFLFHRMTTIKETVSKRVSNGGNVGFTKNLKNEEISTPLNRNYINHMYSFMLFDCLLFTVCRPHASLLAKSPNSLILHTWPHATMAGNCSFSSVKCESNDALYFTRNTNTDEMAQLCQFNLPFIEYKWYVINSMNKWW